MVLVAHNITNARGAGLRWMALLAALLLIPAMSQGVQAMSHKDRTAGAGDRTGSAAPPARMQPRPVFALACPTDTPQHVVLCRMLQSALAEKAPGYAFRRVDALESAPGGAGTMAVALELEHMDAHGITARLTWRDPQTGATTFGPLIGMSVQDAELSPRMYPAFIDSLLDASDLPLGDGAAPREE